MQLVEGFVHNPVKVAVGVLLVALFGVIGFLRMPKQLTPEVEIPKISIETRWPGASPQEVEREIVQEQEEFLQSVEGVTKMSAECADSSGSITLEFPVGTDLSEALLKVNARLQQVPEYPEEADQPVISTSDPRANAIAWFILRPRVAPPEEIAAFAQENPELAPLLEPVRKAHNTGLRARRMQMLVEEHPEIVDRIGPLLPADVDVSKLGRFAEDFIEARFERVPGVSNSNAYGGREEEMQVIVDPQELAARGLTILDVRNALRRQNRDVSAGDLWEGKRRYVIRTLGRFSSPEQVGDVILGVEGNAPVYLRDVAEIRLGYKKPVAVVKNFGTVSMAINCVRETGANVLETMEGLQAAAAELNADLLKRRGLELIQAYDETEYIDSSIHLVSQNIWVGGLLTVSVLLLFLRSWRSTLVIALAIPTSLIGTFLVLNLLGRSLNVISLAGLAFAVGMLVDNAVVVLENCYRHAQMGDNALVAAVRGAKEVWGAVVASTLTTLAVFLPVLFVQEEAGQLFRDIALAISSAVGLSLIVSVTVIPAAAARLLRAGNRGGDADSRDGPPRRRRGVLARIDGLARKLVDGVIALNRFLQHGTLRQIGAAVGMVALAIGIAYALMPQVEYLPAGTRNLVIGMLLPPPGYNIDQALKLGVDIEDATQEYWDVDLDDPAVTSGEIPAIDRYFFVARTQMVFFGLRAVRGDQVGRLIDVVNRVAAQLPGTIPLVSRRALFSSELGAGRNVDVEITGPELEKLIEMGQQIMGTAPVLAGETKTIPLDEVQESDRVIADDEQAGTATVLVEPAGAFPKPSLDLNSPEVHVRRKREQAADMGVTTEELGYTVDALIDGAYATDYYVGGDKIDLTILGNQRYAKRTQDLRGLAVATPSGDLARLESLAEVRLSGGPEQINRRERQRAITISVTPPPSVPLEAAINAIDREIVQPRVASGQVGGDYRIALAGTADKLVATWNALRWNFLLALLVTYLLMAALFESWLYPFVIILSVPLGAVGGFVGLWLLNGYLSLWPYSEMQSLDVLTMLGFVILIGTVVNNPILIVHQSLNHMREEGMAPDEAVLASVRNRVRPIFMTTATTVLGLAPLVLFPGSGAELYRGLGAVVLGGLAVSTVFTLVLVPTVFSLMMRSKAALARMLRLRAPSERIAEDAPPSVSPAPSPGGMEDTVVAQRTTYAAPGPAPLDPRAAE